MRNQVEASRDRAVPAQLLYTAPWWALLLVLFGLYIAFLIVTDTDYGGAFQFLQQGIPMTLYVSFSAYGLALIVGLFVGLARVNPPKPVLVRGFAAVFDVALRSLCESGRAAMFEVWSFVN